MGVLCAGFGYIQLNKCGFGIWIYWIIKKVILYLTFLGYFTCGDISPPMWAGMPPAVICLMPAAVGLTSVVLVPLASVIRVASPPGRATVNAGLYIESVINATTGCNPFDAGCCGIDHAHDIDHGLQAGLKKSTYLFYGKPFIVMIHTKPFCSLYENIYDCHLYIS